MLSRTAQQDSLSVPWSDQTNIQSLYKTMPVRHSISFVGLFTNLSCVSLNASSERLAMRLQNHTFGICLISLHYGFSSDSLNYLPGSMYSHTGCICLIFLHCALSDVTSNCLFEMMHSHIDCTCTTFLHRVFSNVFSSCLFQMMHSHTAYI